MKDSIDVVFSFDTTGSMASYISQVRQNKKKTISDLFKHIPNLRVGLISHGDYCDGDDVINILDLTKCKQSLKQFIRTTPNTFGGDSPECYELVLNEARNFNWTSGKNKALVVIGDSTPHQVGYRYGSYTNKLDWKNELGLLVESGINVYPVKCLNWGTHDFYNHIARVSGTPKLTLNQFSNINDLLTAICFERADKLNEVEKVIGRKSVRRFVEQLKGTVKTRYDVTELEDGVANLDRFQVFSVPYDCSIKDFVEDEGLVFKKGKGFYEWTKTETIQDYKDVVAISKDDEDMVYFGKAARKKLGIPMSTTRAKPPRLSKDQG